MFLFYSCCVFQVQRSQGDNEVLRATVFRLEAELTAAREETGQGQRDSEAARAAVSRLEAELTAAREETETAARETQETADRLSAEHRSVVMLEGCPVMIVCPDI